MTFDDLPLPLLVGNGLDLDSVTIGDTEATIIRLLDWDDIGPFYEVILSHPGVDVNIPNTNNKTPLHFATRKGNHAAVKLLLAHEADVNWLSTDKTTPLFFATSKPEILRALLEAGANPNLGENYGFTCLMDNIWFWDNVESLELLLEHNAALESEYNGPTDYFAGWTALTFAADYGNTAVVRLLADAGANLQHVGEDGIPILHYAAMSPRDPTGKLAVLLEFLTRLNPALHVGTPVQNLKRLLNAGAEINIQDKQGQTALTSQSGHGNVEAVKLFLERGADVNACGGQFGYALNAAAMMSRPAMIDQLIENGARWDIKDYMGRTPIHFAALQGVQNFQKAVEIGCDLAAHDVTGRTALMWAAQPGQVEVVERILDKRVVVTGSDGRNWTPLKIARYHGALPEVVELLTCEGDGDSEDKSKVGRDAKAWCDSCFSHLHPSVDHEFEEHGPEFEAEEGGKDKGEEGKNTSDSEDSSTDTSSEDDSEE
ncbi:ankyrin repeat-containing domain protein [Cercophora scortea]|uniref:Ankyrin repeat-containing domain protein n=1 Tax=Cercophora scortea TaxID=314031 RepID=A0AAE0IHE3_9PEZI|nr:ankyrin repeat-containing domain protein [Cercophora scortea]